MRGEGQGRGKELRDNKRRKIGEGGSIGGKMGKGGSIGGTREGKR